MFCVLTVKRREDNISEKLLGKLKKDSYTLLTVPVLHGAPFYHLTVNTGKKGIDFERVIFEVGRCAQRLLVSDNIILPEIKGIGRFNSDLLYKKLLANTAAFILQQIGDKALYDEKNGIITYRENVIEIGKDRNDFNLAEHYSSLKPSEIEQYIFAAALYELCGVFAIGECRFDFVTLNGEKKSVGNVYFA